MNETQSPKFAFHVHNVHRYDEALRVDSGCRQAETLKAAAEEKIAKDGLIGLGAVGVGAAVIGGVLSALAASGRRR